MTTGQYASFVLLGFFIARFTTFESVIKRHKKIFLSISVISLLILFFGYKIHIFTTRSAYDIFSGIVGYFGVLAFLGFAQTYLNKKTKLHAYLTESAFPVYILHQASIVVPGFFIVQLNINMFVKYILLLLVAISSTMMVYHFIVKRNNITRFLFGMKLK